jgi:hypothetical protein
VRLRPCASYGPAGAQQSSVQEVADRPKSFKDTPARDQQVQVPMPLPIQMKVPCFVL